MDPPAAPSSSSPSSPPHSSSSSSLFQVYLRLRPPPSPLVQLNQQSLYPTLSPPERWLTVEPPTIPTSPTPAPPPSSDDLQAPLPTPTHITLHPPRDSRKRAVEKFAFTRVFEEEAEQGDVFRGAGVAGVVKGVLMGEGGGGEAGRDGLVATLGVTGSGKSHTILGSKTQRGLTQLSLDLLYRSLGRQVLHPAESPSLVASLCATDASEAQIFSAGAFLDNVYGEGVGGASRAGTPMTDTHSTANMPKRRLPQRPSALPQFPDISAMNVPVQPNAEYTILISMYEVYNDRIFDLLTIPTNTKDLRRRHLLFKSTEASPDRKVVAGLRKVVCGTYDEALMVLETGLHERRVAGTGSNSVSSRSHGFFVVEVKRRVKGGMSSLWSGATMTIVDLAGSERARNARTAGATLAEAGKINESLMYLGQCLQMQSDQSQENGNKPSLVPFRQCKLTELLFSNSFPSSHNHHNYTNQPATHHHHRNPQKAVMIVTADPVGDFNATSQILRYSALAREVTVPRIPSVSSTILAGIFNNNSNATESSQLTHRNASGNTPSEQQHQNPSSFSSSAETSEMIDLAFTEIARLTEHLDILTLRLDDETARRHDAEANWARAEDAIERIETQVRDECWRDMEAKLAEERRRWGSAWGEEMERGGEFVDRKIDLLSSSSITGGKGFVIHDDGEGGLEEEERVGAYVEQLETENEALRGKVEDLVRELGCRSPTKVKSKAKSKSPTKQPPKMPSLSLDGSGTIPVDEESSVLRDSMFKLNAMQLGHGGGDGEKKEREKEVSLGGQMEEEQEEEVMATPMKKKSLQAGTLGSGRKVRKLTARKWDLMDEGEMDGYGGGVV